MKPRAPCLALVLLLGCGGDGDGSENELTLDPEPACELGSACLSAGTRSLEIGGLRVLHRQLRGHPLVAMHLLFEAEQGSGRQLWSEDLALELFDLAGPERFSSSTWAEELLRLSAYASAYGGIDYGGIAAGAPLPHWRELWQLLVEGIARPQSSAYFLDFLRGVHQRAYLSERDEPDTAASVDAWSRLFRGRLQERRRETQAALAGVTIADTHAAWDGLRSTERMLVTIVGDVSETELEQAVLELSDVTFPGHFAAFPAEPAPAPATSADVTILPYPDSPTWHVVSYFAGPGRGSTDHAALDVGLRVLGRRLFYDLRDERGLTYSAGARLLPYRDAVGYVWLSTPSPEEALPLLRGAVADLKAQGPTEDELTAARAQLRTALLTASDDPSGLAFTLSDWTLRNPGAETVDAYLEQLATVDASRVQSVVQAYVRDVKSAAAGPGDALTLEQLTTLYLSP